MTHWAKFTDAERDLRELGANSTKPPFDEYYRSVADLIPKCQRFYLPDGHNLLEKASAIDAVKDQLAPPYDALAILSECGIGEDSVDNHVARGWRITIAVTPDSPLSPFREPVVLPARSVMLFSVANLPSTGNLAGTSGRWMMAPPVPGYTFPTPAGESSLCMIRLMIDERAPQVEEHADRFSRELLGDASVLWTLCALLSITNTRSPTVAPPPALNRKRQRNGKLPLYDYHVLEVGGERWTSPLDSSGSGSVFRSHLRRGHIRRLDATRTTWVRSAYVHGGIPGFVDKDYQVKDV